MTRYWDQGVYVGVIVGGLILLALLVLLASFIVLTAKDQGDYRKARAVYPARLKEFEEREPSWKWHLKPSPPERDVTGFWAVGWTVVGIAAVLAIIYGIGYPWQAQYHSRVLVTGVVAEKVERTPYTDTGTPEWIMFRLEGDPEGRFVYHDLRSVAAQPGDTIGLMCRQQWKYGAQSWSDCEWATDRVNR